MLFKDMVRDVKGKWTFKAPGGPARFPGADDGPKGPAPTMGQHTHEILSALGYSEAEILAASGA